MMRKEIVAKMLAIITYVNNNEFQMLNFSLYVYRKLKLFMLTNQYSDYKYLIILNDID